MKDSGWSKSMYNKLHWSLKLAANGEFLYLSPFPVIKTWTCILIEVPSYMFGSHDFARSASRESKMMAVEFKIL